MTHEKYKASKWGYAPHDNQSKLFCPHCGCDEFYSPHQSINIDAEYWGYELECIKCHWIIGADVKRMKI